jgi:hypothetical protein
VCTVGSASDPTVSRTITALAADLSAVLAAVDSARAQARRRDTQKNHQARWAPDDLVFTTWHGKPLRNLNFRRDMVGVPVTFSSSGQRYAGVTGTCGRTMRTAASSSARVITGRA